MKISTKEMVTSGLLIALAVILSNPMFKLMGSIGLDAIPAFFGASVISPLMGGLVGGIAHIVSAMLTGFPFSLPVHLVVMVMMFITCYLYGVSRKKFNPYVAMIVGIVMNGPVTLLISAYTAKLFGIEFSGMAMFLALLGPLTLVSSANIVIAEVIYGLVGHQLEKSLES